MAVIVDRKLIKELRAREEKRLQQQTPNSAKLYERARESLIKGVASSYQMRDPYPIYFTHGKGSRVWDVDGREVSDFHNAFGCMVQGHAHPAIVEAVQKRMELGSQFALPAEDSIIVGGLLLSSRVLRKNLDQVERIFPYVITLGSKLGEKQNTCSDLLENYYLDSIGNLALTSVQKQLKKHLQSKFALEKMSSMAPGSLSDWPIEEQGPLFKLLGDVEASIGVRLTRNLLMIPAKSISGFYFPTEVSFYSCQLCPRKRCESRKAKYNEALTDEYGIKN